MPWKMEMLILRAFKVVVGRALPTGSAENEIPMEQERSLAMKLVVFNGSPKGNLSATLQYVRFIEKKFPQHEVKIFHVAERINAIEKEETKFQEIIEAVKASDGVLWAFPLYYYLVCSQYKRFIELLWRGRRKKPSKGSTLPR